MYYCISMHKPMQVAPAPIYTGRKPVRSAPYLRFVKAFSCVACGSCRLVDPAHTGAHAGNQKSSDMHVIALCRECHRAFDSDPRTFAAAHGLDVAGLIQHFNRLWDERIRRTA